MPPTQPSEIADAPPRGDSSRSRWSRWPARSPPRP